MAFCYNLISCNPAKYASQFTLESPTFIFYDGAIVTISGFPANYYTLEYIGENNCEFPDPIPILLSAGLETCPPLPDVCLDERTISYAEMVQIPKSEPPNRGFKECCYSNVVLADIDSDEDYKNDYESFFFKYQNANSTGAFILNDSSNNTYNLNDSTYGSIQVINDANGTQSVLIYTVEWRKVLMLLGEGDYFVTLQATIGGVVINKDYNTVSLKKFSLDVADNSIRIDSVISGTLVHLGIDFKDAEMKTSRRVRGFFGARQPKFEQDNIVKRDYSIEQISMSQENKYSLQTELLPVCITDEIYDLLLFGNGLFINDYNLNNHSYGFVKFAVELDSNKGASYYSTIRDSRLQLTFKDRIKNKRKINC